MSELSLSMPSEKDLAEVSEFKQEFFDAGEKVINGGALLDQLDLHDWLDLVRRNNTPETVPHDWVVSSTFIARRNNDNRIVGIIDVRHNLGTEFLATYGGHIGYAVRPSERAQGYAKEMLKHAISFSHRIGITELMLGCYANNQASIRVIEACGGIFRETKSYIDGKPMVTYTISTS